MAKYININKASFTGRKEELDIINTLLISNQAELLAVIGRRRVGKTFLIRSFFQEQIIFEMTGVRDISTEQQLKNFSLLLEKLSGSTLPLKQPSD